MGIQGTGLSEQNVRLRFFGLIFCGIIAFGAILYWRQAELSNAEYVQFDIHKSEKSENSGLLRSNKYQIDVEEASPSVN